MQPLSPVQLKQFSIWIEMCDMITIWINCNRLSLSGYSECYFIAKAAGILTLGKVQKRQNQKLLIQLLLVRKGAGCLSKSHIFPPTSDMHMTPLHTTQTLIVQYFFPLSSLYNRISELLLTRMHAVRIPSPIIMRTCFLGACHSLKLPYQAKQLNG